MKETAYISGPMTGVPEYNYPMFDKARDYLKSQGFDVISPADLDRRFGYVDYETALSRDLDAMTAATVIVLLPGWELSQGARIEYNTALELGHMRAMTYDPDGNLLLPYNPGVYREDDR